MPNICKPPPLGDIQLQKPARLVAALKAQRYTKERLVDYIRREFGRTPKPTVPRLLVDPEPNKTRPQPPLPTLRQLQKGGLQPDTDPEQIKANRGQLPEKGDDGRRGAEPSRCPFPNLASCWSIWPLATREGT